MNIGLDVDNVITKFDEMMLKNFLKEDKKRLNKGIVNTDLKLYDYVQKGTLLGEVDKYLYLVYKKDGNILNYEEYLK